MKKYMNSSIIYAILAMIGGVFFREFTKFQGFTGKTTLSVVHTHYFVLGMLFFLILMILEKNFHFTDKKTDRTLIFYHIGLNMTAIMLAIRGILQVLNTEMSGGLNAAISGIAGLGHIILGVSVIVLLFSIKKKVTE